MKEIRQAILTGERALFASKDIRIVDSIFENGESPLKESADVALVGSSFRWKYPLWYCDNVTADNCVWYEAARAGVWYSNRVSLRNCVVQAPKNFRRCKGLSLENVSLLHAAETLWHCENVRLSSVTAKGDYFAMDSSDLEVDGLTLDGNYSFDGVRNAVIRNSRLITKDAFWNSENVTVYDSFISGEYLGWNAKNLTLVNCTVESLQGMCYIENLRMVDCKLINTTLAFEYSDVDATITSRVDSVLNPKSGTIRAEAIGELIIEKDRVDPARTNIVCSDVAKRSDHPEWIGDSYETV